MWTPRGEQPETQRPAPPRSSVAASGGASAPAARRAAPAAAATPPAAAATRRARARVAAALAGGDETLARIRSRRRGLEVADEGEGGVEGGVDVGGGARALSTAIARIAVPCMRASSSSF